jgi:hypothetical protein
LVEIETDEPSRELSESIRLAPLGHAASFPVLVWVTPVLRHREWFW